MNVPEYGIAGVALAAMAYFIMYLMKQHKEERSDWQKAQERQTDEANRNINRNTEVLSSLKTLIETIKK